MLPTFIEQRFPEDISYGSGGGPSFATSVFQASSGGEQRNVLWAEARAKYNIASGIRDKTDADKILAFFMNVRGRAIGFRFKDWADYEILNQNIGTGNGVTTTYQLIKDYVVGPQKYTRVIRKPVAGSLLTLTVAAVALSEGVGYTVNNTTGIITFVVPPPVGAAIVIPAAQFDVPVRFDVDELPLVHEAFLQESMSSIPLVELRANA
jgi:uncharacterized protein (TIGR02217 family)